MKAIHKFQIPAWQPYWSYLHHRSVQYVVLIVLMLATTWHMTNRISNTYIEKDAAQNFLMGYNLYKYGVLSLSTEDQLNPEPTQYREPLPPIIMALYMSLTDFDQSIALDQGRETGYEVLEGSYVTSIMYLNIVWALLCIVAFWVVTYQLTGSLLATLWALVASYGYFILGKVNSLYTELPAAALLYLGIAILIWGIKGKKKIGLFVAGAVIGALCLTKATILYVAPLAILSVAAYQVIAGDWRLTSAIQFTLVFLLGLVIIITPWMIRNYYHFDSFTVTSRSGIVLLVRAHKNQMTSEEFWGSFYAWTPTPLQKPVGGLLGFTLSDLESGGRLQRLNRELPDDIEAAGIGRADLTVSYYRTAFAELNAFKLEYADQGVANPELLAERAARERAVSMIRRAPLNHLRMTIPFAWRGIWAFDLSAFNPQVISALINLAAFVALIIMPFAAIRWKRIDIWSFGVFLLSPIFFFALSTHNIPRYNAIAVPGMLISAVILMHCAVLSVSVRLRNKATGANPDPTHQSAVEATITQI